MAPYLFFCPPFFLCIQSYHGACEVFLRLSHPCSDFRFSDTKPGGAAKLGRRHIDLLEQTLRLKQCRTKFEDEHFIQAQYFLECSVDQFLSTPELVKFLRAKG